MCVQLHVQYLACVCNYLCNYMCNTYLFAHFAMQETAEDEEEEEEQDENEHYGEGNRRRRDDIWQHRFTAANESELKTVMGTLDLVMHKRARMAANGTRYWRCVCLCASCTYLPTEGELSISRSDYDLCSSIKKLC